MEEEINEIEDDYETFYELMEFDNMTNMRRRRKYTFY